jgi:hypothetical protein
MTKTAKLLKRLKLCKELNLIKVLKMVHFTLFIVIAVLDIDFIQ